MNKRCVGRTQTGDRCQRLTHERERGFPLCHDHNLPDDLREKAEQGVFQYDGEWIVTAGMKIHLALRDMTDGRTHPTEEQEAEKERYDAALRQFEEETGMTIAVDDDLCAVVRELEEVAGGKADE